MSAAVVAGGTGVAATCAAFALFAAVRLVLHGRARRRVAVAALSVLALVVGTATAAWADSRWDGDVYHNTVEEWCTYLSTHFSNTQARPRMDSFSRFDTYDIYYPSDCGHHGAPTQTNYVAVRQDLYFWNGSSWVVCNTGPWVYNVFPSGQASTGFGWSSPPCRTGYYTDDAGAFVTNGGPWYGGWRAPNYLYVS